MEELDKVFSKASTPTFTPLPAPLSTLLSPFLTLAARTQTSITYKRIHSALLEPLFTSLAPPTVDEDQPRSAKRIRLSTAASDDVPYPHIVSNSCFDDPKTEGPLDGAVLKKKLLRRVFEVASEPETKDSNRRKMYALWKGGVEEDEEE